MPSQGLDVLIASVHWEREKDLTVALTDEGFRVECTPSGETALTYLSGEQACRLVVLGRELDGRNPFDLLFEASNLRHGKQGPKILLSQNIRSDYELVALLGRRGVTAYLEENDDLSGHVRAAVGMLYAEQRASARHPYKCAATLTWSGGEVRGKTTDLSLSGVGFVLDAKSARKLPPRGGSVSLLLLIDSPAFVGPDLGDDPLLRLSAAEQIEPNEMPLLPCAIRSVSIKSRLFGDIALVGLEFDRPSDRMKALIKRELDHIKGPQQS
jgi:hypothetical protein